MTNRAPPRNPEHRSGGRIRTLLAAAMLAAAAPAASVQSMMFLKGSPLNHFDKQDVDLMMDNARQVLVSDSGAKSEWRNPKTGSSGDAEVTGEYTADGMPCRRLRVANSAKGLKAEATYPVCKYPTHGWRVRPETP